MEESAGRDLEVNRSDAANDVVLSQSDDLLIAVSNSITITDGRSSGPGNETSIEQIGTVEIDDKSVDMVNTSEQIEVEMPKLLETPEPEKSGKNVKFNLRKSLAWDSAFFSSDGVLDAEELSTMIEGGEKGVKHQLPGIEEEVYRSMESISTLASDNLTLECLEAELFEDIRASIQKSNRSSNLTNSSSKVSSGKKDSQAKVSSSSKKVNLDSGKRPAVRIKDHSTSIPQPKIISRVNSTSTITTKRASLSTNHAKKDQDIAKQPHVNPKGNQTAKTKNTQGSKVTRVIGPQRGVPKPLLSSKSSSVGPSTALKKEPTRLSSSCSNSSSCSSGNDVKSSTTLLRRKVDSKTGKLTAGSIPKTPTRINMKNKTPPANSRLSSQSVISNISSSISPASSVSEWSVESSSSSTKTTSNINRMSTSRGCINNGVFHRSSVESSLSINHLTGRISNQNGNQPPAVQPTGLRMPSPKIGFFDAGKSGVRTPNGGTRSKLPTGVTKTGATHSSPTNSYGVKLGKIPPPKSAAAAHSNMKPNPQKTVPKPSQEQPKTKNCLVTSDVSDHKGEEIKLVSRNVDNDSNEFNFHSGNKSLIKTDTHENGQVEMSKVSSEVCSNKVDKSITDGSRTPFAVKNSVCDTIETATEVTEKTVDFPLMETEHKENNEVI